MVGLFTQLKTSGTVDELPQVFTAGHDDSSTKDSIKDMMANYESQFKKKVLKGDDRDYGYITNYLLSTMNASNGSILTNRTNPDFPNYQPFEYKMQRDRIRDLDPFDKIEYPDVNEIQKRYNSTYSENRLPDLLKEIESQRNPHEFKEVVLGCIQLYYDGLVELETPSNNPEIWEQQLETLNAMLAGVQMTVAAFYRQDRDIPFDQVLEVIMPHDSFLIEYGSQKEKKIRHLSREGVAVREYAINVAATLKDGEIDVIMPIASGGFEPAALTASYLGISQMFPVRYSRVSRGDKDVLVPTEAPADYAEQQISGKRVLMVDDIIASGATVSKLMEWITKGYTPREIQFAVVHSDHNSNFHRSLGLYQDHESPYLFRYKLESIL